MFRPASVNICGIPHTIKYLDSVDFMNSEGVKIVGEYNSSQQIITVCAGNDEYVWHILWHEILHALSDLLHVEWLNEEGVDTLALGLSDLLIRNNWLAGTIDFMKNPPTTLPIAAVNVEEFTKP